MNLATRWFRLVACAGVCFWLLAVLPAKRSFSQFIETDLLIVGGTESGVAAAIQAARMEVRSIVLVNDIHWLGGQFSAEAVSSIDENRGVLQNVPFPRAGLFKEVMDRIEAFNLHKYGHQNPGNAWTSRTTCRPSEAEAVFRQLIMPYLESGQLRILSGFYPVATELDSDGKTLRAVRFAALGDGDPLTVRAGLTIDASDWGEVIQASGADYEFGPDLKSKYGEPNAPVDRSRFPTTDLNPITYCMVIEETGREETIAKPAHYDDRKYFLTTSVTKADYDSLPWPHPPHRPFNPPWLGQQATGTFYRGERTVYSQRRLIDHYGHSLKDPQQQDVILLCWTLQDYPLDVLPRHVRHALEATEVGAADKNLVEMTRSQRQIVLADAKQHSLGMLYHLQTTVHQRMQDRTHSFRRFRLTDEFGTPDRLPPKPYVRESLRMKAMYMMREQDVRNMPVRGHGKGKSDRFARAMYHDGVACFQFPFDFHMTGRMFLPGDENGSGPWQSYFKKDDGAKAGRGWSTNTDRALVSLRSLVPERIDGLLAGQHSPGCSSIVSSALRLHDHTMAIGQAAGATAALCLRHDIQPRDIPFNRGRLVELQIAIASSQRGGQPAMLWPFADLSPEHPAFTAVNLLAVQRCLPLYRDDVRFEPDQPPTTAWMQAVIRQTKTQTTVSARDKDPLLQSATRGQFAIGWWNRIARSAWKPYSIESDSDADGDGIADSSDALPLDPENRALKERPVSPLTDGLPEPLPADLAFVRQFNFAGPGVPAVGGFTLDQGRVYDSDRGFGWHRDITANHRRRGRTAMLADTFLFTRTHDVWRCALPNGRYRVTVCIGDSDYEQSGQNVTIQGVEVFRDHFTSRGRFAEHTVTAEVEQNMLTVEIGRSKSTTNTCLNWLQIAR